MPGAALRAIVLSVVAWVATGCPDPPPPRPQNLLLISLDTMTPARMSLYGHDRANTPTLERLAKHAVTFRKAYSTSSWTLPAHASMLTGLYPTSIAPDATDRRLYKASTLLAEMFASKGHRTGAVVGGGFVSDELGASDGFESFQERAGVRAALEWIDAHRDEPFFFFFHTYSAHSPYNDRRYAESIEPGRLAGLYAGGTKEERTRLHNMVHTGRPKLDAEEKEYVLALYDGGIARADAMVGALLDGLSAMGLADDTAIVVTSDHGEEFWQHTARGAAHGHTLHGELLQVPLLWYEPGLHRGQAAVDEPVSLVDIAPTIISRFGLEPRADLDGLDLTPLLETGSWDVDRFLFAEGPRTGRQHTAVMGPAGKLIELRNPQNPDAPQRHRLYLPNDPHEQTSRAGTDAPVAQELSAALRVHQRAAASSEPAVAQEPLDEKTRQRLRELGYVE